MGQEVYDAIGERLEAAFTAFRRQHELQHPQPEKPVRQARRDWMMRALLFLVVIAGFIVSGSRTIVIFAIGKTMMIGGASVVMLEGAAVVMSFYYTREKYREQEMQRGYIGRYLRAGSLFAVIVMCAGNTQDVLQIDGFATGNLWTALSLPIAISVALAAPLMVFIAGHVLALLSVLDMAQDRKAEQDYNTRLDEWNEDMLRSWQAQKARWGASVNVQVDRPSAGQLSGQQSTLLSARTPDGRTRTDSGHGYERNASGKEIVRQHLTEHPEDITAKVRELALRLGVGRTTVSEVQREFKGGSHE